MKIFRQLGFSVCVYRRKQGFFFWLSPLFDIIFCVRCFFVWPYLLQQQQINGWQNQKHSCFNLSVCINGHVPSNYVEDEKSRVAFSCVLSSSSSSIILRSNSTSLRVHTWHPLALCHCWCWAFSINVTFMLLFSLLIGQPHLRHLLV